MAHPIAGSTKIDINGTTYTLKPSINATCALEDLLSTPGKRVTIQEVIEYASQGSISHIRALFWSYLYEHHPSVTLKESGELIQQFGGIDKLNEALAGLVSETAPDPKDLETAGVRRARPRKAAVNGRADGTGPA